MGPSPEIKTISNLTYQIVKDLSSGLSVLVTGLPDSGRSYLLGLVNDELNLQGVSAVTLAGNRVFSEWPLAALTLEGIDIIDDRPSMSNNLALLHAADSLGAMVSRPNSVLIIDDADALDRASLGVIVHVRRQKRIPLLLVSSYGIYQSDLMTGLIAVAQPGVTVKMKELSLEEITQMTRTILSADVEIGTMSKIASLSGGLPGLVQTIVRSGRRDGRLVFKDGVWKAAGSLWTSELQLTLAPFLAGLSQESVDRLAQLAKTGEATWAEAEELVGPAQVGEFVRRGLLRFNQISSSVGAYVYPPALAELLRRGDDAYEARDGLQRNPTLRTKTNATKSWSTYMADLDATAMANRILAHWRVEASRQQDRWDKDPVPRNAIPLLISLMSGGVDDDDITDVFEKTLHGSDLNALMEFVTLKATYLANCNHDLATALAELEQFRHRFPQFDIRLRGHEAHLTLVCDRIPEADILDLPAGAVDTDGMLIMAQAEAMIAQGRIHDAADLLASFNAHNDRVIAIKRTLQGLVQVLDGDIAGGVEWAVKRLRDAVFALDTRSIMGPAYVAALGMCMLGRFKELEPVIEVIYRLVNVTPFQNHLKAGALMLGAFAAKWGDKSEYARSLACQAESLGRAVGPFPGMRVSHDLFSRSMASKAGAWDEVDDMLGRGYIVDAAYMAVDAAEVDPDPGRAARLIELGLATQSSVIHALTTYVDTMVSGDVNRFEPTVAELRQVCGPLDVIRARVSWALCWRGMGNTRSVSAVLLVRDCLSDWSTLWG